MVTISNWGNAMLTSLANAINLILTFIPRIIGFLLILLVGWLIAMAVSKGVVWLLFANIARYAIIGFAALIALEQLQIAPTLINELFGAIVAAAAIAFGLAFGLGGQDSARRWLNRGENSLTTAASQIQAQPQQPSAPVQGQYTDQEVRTQQKNNSYQQYDETPTQTPINRPPTR
jgi:hypothetical protein